ncbi:MAG: hypothetical protein KVP17_001135 [Porospora cf. gigantea B]|uniref:uncharacterized protein n=1 Tax=Porospora cf. gigantea B TaxID=2853592 RepID=UPI0035719069|nr:MAG: hypothetical protein KVP17_001135 [Porospora cf. gigantea B]
MQNFQVINERDLQPDKLLSQPVIGTHDGRFHCDEVTAIALLKLLPAYRGADVIRSRNPDTHQQMTVLVDVGAAYDPDRKRFDHHQRSFVTQFPKDRPVTKLSSAGLIWLHMGKQILTEYFGVDEKSVDQVWRKAYDDFFESIDAIDNGVNVGDPVVYRVRSDLSSRVARLHPQWNDVEQDDVKPFRKALEMCNQEIHEQITPIINSWLPARSIVEDSITADSTIVLPKWVPYEEHLYAIEQETGRVGHYLFVVYPAYDKGYKVKCVSKELGSFTNRLSLPAKYCGARGAELPAGIEFVRRLPYTIDTDATGFIGATSDLETAFKLTKEACDSALQAK